MKYYLFWISGQALYSLVFLTSLALLAQGNYFWWTISMIGLGGGAIGYSHMHQKLYVKRDDY